MRGVRMSELADTVSQFSFLKNRLRQLEGKFGMAVYNYFKVEYFFSQKLIKFASFSISTSAAEI